MPLLGQPMLARQIERIRRASRIDVLVVATSTDRSDDDVDRLCQRLGVRIFRGSLDDVLTRFYEAAVTLAPDHVVRLTGDCPLVDPQVIDSAIETYLEGDFDYLNNALGGATFPDGLDVEIFRFSALEEAHRKADLPSHREHVTLYLKAHPDRFRLGVLRNEKDLSNLRWTVDELPDFEFVQRVYEQLYPLNPQFSMADVLALLEREPSLRHINSHIGRNEGLKKSLHKDQTVSLTSQSNNLRMQQRARGRIPGMTQLLSKRPDMFSDGVWPGYFSKAKGCEVWDLDGNHYIDMSIGGIGANVLGYADSDVDAAVVQAVKNGTSCSLNCPEEVELADLLCELHPWADMVRYARTGGEAMAIAVRIARAHTGRDTVAFCGYHGWHDWYLSANLGTQNALGEHLLPGLEPRGVPRGLRGTALPFRYNRIEELKDIVSRTRDDLAAIVMEPLRSEKPVAGFVEEVRAIANQSGAVLIVDEISAGFRLNSGGAHLLFGLAPDVAVFSKALGNGYPIAAILGRSRVMEAAQRTFISSTYWTERIGPTAAIAMIKKHREREVAKHLIGIGERVQAGWRTLLDRHQLRGAVRGIAPLSHFVFDHPQAQSLKALFIQLMLDRGFLASNSFYAMYAHRSENVDAYLSAVDSAFCEIAASIERGTTDALLKGKPSQVGFKRLA